MKYKEVEKWVSSNFLDVTAHDSSQGSNVGNKVTVDWNIKRNFASYLSCEIDDNKIHKILLWDFDDDELKVLALLHELGHHTECQDGDDVYKEIRAWEGCFKWMKHLGIKWNKKLTDTASEWFSSYIELYGITEERSNWMIKVGFSYIPSKHISTDKYNLEISSEPLCSDIEYIPYVVESNPINPIVKNKPKSENKVWGFEKWKKRY